MCHVCQCFELCILSLLMQVSVCDCRGF